TENRGSPGNPDRAAGSQDANTAPAITGSKRIARKREADMSALGKSRLDSLRNANPRSRAKRRLQGIPQSCRGPRVRGPWPVTDFRQEQAHAAVASPIVLLHFALVVRSLRKGCFLSAGHPATRHARIGVELRPVDLAGAGRGSAPDAQPVGRVQDG